MKTGDIDYMDEEVKDLFITMGNAGWVRVISACAGHGHGIPDIDSTNLFYFEIDVYDRDRFEELKRIVDEQFEGVQWGGVIPDDRIVYKYVDSEDQSQFIALLTKLFVELEPHS